MRLHIKGGGWGFVGRRRALRITKIVKGVRATSDDVRDGRDGDAVDDSERAEWVRQTADGLGPLTDRDREVLGLLLMPRDP